MYIGQNEGYHISTTTGPFITPTTAIYWEDIGSWVTFFCLWFFEIKAPLGQTLQIQLIEYK